MYLYEFLKNNIPVNVSYSPKNAAVKFSAGKNNKNTYKDRAAFLSFFREKLTDYLTKNALSECYVVVYIGREKKEKQDLICFYAQWVQCSAETYKRPHILRKCYASEISNFMDLFSIKDFTAEHFERSWYFDKKRKQDKLIDAVNADRQMTLQDLDTPPAKKEKKKTKKQLKTETLCKENGVDPTEIPPWESAKEYIDRKTEDDGKMITAQLMLTRETLNRIIAEYDVKVVSRDDTDIIVEPVETVTDFFASL